MERESHQENALRNVVELLAKTRVLLVALTVIGLVAGIAAAVLVQPTYRATVLLAPATDVEGEGLLGSALGQLGSLASIAGITAGSDSRTEEALAIMKSKRLTQDFLIDHNWTEVLFPKEARWRRSKEPTLADAYKKFDKDVRRIEEDKKTGLVSVHVDWSDPAMAAQWANDLVETVNLAMRERDISEADRSINLLKKEMAQSDLVSLREGISRQIDIQIRRKTLASVRHDYAFRVLDPAQAADRHDFISPDRPLYILGGGFVGFLFAVSYVLMTEFIRRELLAK